VTRLEGKTFPDEGSRPSREGGGAVLSALVGLCGEGERTSAEGKGGNGKNEENGLPVAREKKGKENLGGEREQEEGTPKMGKFWDKGEGEEVNRPWPEEKNTEAKGGGSLFQGSLAPRSAVGKEKGTTKRRCSGGEVKVKEDSPTVPKTADMGRGCNGKKGGGLSERRMVNRNESTPSSRQHS